jgi:hypothetical protein
LHACRSYTGEQERLSPRRQLGYDAANVGHESHVEHPVGFIQHENLNGTQVDESLVHQVKQPAGRGNEDVNALLQGPRLSVLTDAAEDHRLPNRGVAAIRPKALADLGGQFPRGREDQDANRPASSLWSRLGSHQSVQGGKGERCRLAGAGLCAAQQVARGKDMGNRLGLDRSWGGVTFAINGAQEGLGEPKHSKHHKGLVGQTQDQMR